MTTSDSDKFWATIHQFDTCMVVTRDGGRMRARPMAPRLRGEDRKLYFLTKRMTHKVEEIALDDDVACTFSKHGQYMSLSGRAEVVGDRSLVTDLWDASAEAWLPEGRDSPDVVVLVVEPDSAEIWDVKASRITQAWEFAKAYVGGNDRPQIGEQRKIDL